MLFSAGKRVSHTYTIVLHASPEAVFPLFTPEGEIKWAAGWDYQPVFPTPWVTERDSVFMTSSQSHNQNNAIWVVTTHDPEKYTIEYLRVEPGMKVGQITINLQEQENGDTAVTVRYMYTGLSAQGNEFIESFTENYYAQFIATWEEALNYYLKTGELLNI